MARYPQRMSELLTVSSFAIPLPIPIPTRAVFTGAFSPVTCIAHPDLALDFFSHFSTRYHMYVVHSHA